MCWRGAAPGGEKAEGLALSDPAAEAAGVGWKIGLHKRLTWTAEASAFLGRGAVETKTSYQPKTAEASAVLRLRELADHELEFAARVSRRCVSGTLLPGFRVADAYSKGILADS